MALKNRLAILCCMYKKLSMLIIIIVSISAFAIIMLNVSIIRQFQSNIVSNVQPLKKRTAALVLGASVLRQHKPSIILLERLDKAIELYRLNKVEKLLLSGDNSKQYYNEVTVMKDYVLRHHVKAKDIFLDHSGLRTLDSVYRAKKIYLLSHVYIVSQEFHLPRALFLAKNTYLDAIGVIADSGKYKVAKKTLLREYLARVLAYIDILTDRQPTYLGKTISIEQDGTKTWND